MRRFLNKSLPALSIFPAKGGFNPASQPGASGGWWYKLGTAYVTNSGYVLSEILDAFPTTVDLTVFNGTTKFLEYNNADKAYLYCPGDGTVNNAATAAFANTITGSTLDVRALVAPDVIVNGVDDQMICGQTDVPNNLCYEFGISRSGKIYLSLSSSGNAFSTWYTTYDLSTDFSDGDKFGIRAVVNGDGVRADLTFYTSVDGGGTWTLKETISLVVFSTIFAGTAPFYVAGYDATSSHFAGKIYAASVRDSENGTLVLNFLARRGNAYDNTLLATTGETYTINISASTGYKAQIVDRNIIQFDGNTDDMRSGASWTPSQPVTMYFLVKNYLNGTGTPIFNSTDNTVFMDTANNRVYTDDLAGKTLFSDTQVNPNEFSIITVVLNDTAGQVRINLNNAVSGAVGNLPMDGVVFATLRSGGVYNCMAFIEAIAYAAAHDTATQDAIITNLANRNQFTL